MATDQVRIRTLELRPPLLNGSGAVDVVSADEGWNLPDAALTKLGAFVTKTVTHEPRPGHPQPWAEVVADGTLINAVGLANPGVDAALRDWADLPSRLGIPVIVSIADPHPTELADLARRVDAAGWASGIEINLSCPNVRGGLVAADPNGVRVSVSAVRAVTELPIFAKLSPACGHVAAVACAAVEAGADALTCGNTMPAWHADPLELTPVMGAGYGGGLSGLGLHPVALRLVAEASAAVDVPVVGLGGVDGVAAARRMQTAGARIIGVGTAAVLDPGVIDELATALT